jgi:apolipoprotein N-acyltransferase
MTPKQRTIAAIGATILSAALFALGTGLRPMPWAIWLAPLPILLLVPRVSGRAAFAMAFAGWLGGETPMWSYYLHTVQVGLPLAILNLVGSALLFGLVVTAGRALMVRGRPLLATAVVPAGWVAVEYLFSITAPDGAWWSLAYTQADVLPVLQNASLTGPWGITFLLIGVPTAVAVLLAPGGAGRLRVAVTATMILVLALGYGGWRLRATDGGHTRVALLSIDRSVDPVPLGTPAGKTLSNDSVKEIKALASTGARVVVLPEKLFAADPSSLPVLTRPMAKLAAQGRLDIIAGVLLTRGGVTTNTAIDFPANGGPAVFYDKHHLIPGLESDYQVGHGRATVPGSGGRWGIAICFDMDFPALVRDYRSHGATVMFVPAWDFVNDEWLHSRMAVTRGVENGLTVVRSARQGELTVSDPHGRMLAETTTDGDRFVSVTADLPSRGYTTLYTELGDWFAWTCSVLLLAGITVLIRSRTRSTPRDVSASAPRASDRAGAAG